MKYFVWVLICSLLSVGGGGCERGQAVKEGKARSEDFGAQSSNEAGSEVKEDKPLLLDDEPLLLDEAPLLLEEEGDGESGEGADNSRCHVCHINYSEELIAFRHAGAGIRCAGCHGASDAHIADESWASGGNGTAPDVMFPKDKINPFCMGCHTKEKLLGDQHEPMRAGTWDKVCTDCHGNHRLEVRKCKWK